MKSIRQALLFTVASAALLASAGTFAADDKHWDYAGSEGPEFWGALAGDFAACSLGKTQSPVNLTGMVEGELPALRLDDRAGGSEIVNNGHTIQVNFAPGSSAKVAGRRYELARFHFHAPSESQIEGRAFPLEGHFVHKDSDGNLMVIGVMYGKGAASSELTKAWRYMPAKAGDQKSLATWINAQGLMPANLDYYRFSGSLTTPPCSEGVTWIVLKTSQAVSEGQITAFSQTLGHSNNRPVQPVNARVIVQSLQEKCSMAD